MSRKHLKAFLCLQRWPTCRPPITPTASIVASAAPSRRSPLDPMLEPEAHLPAAFVSPGETLVNVFRWYARKCFWSALNASGCGGFCASRPIRSNET